MPRKSKATALDIMRYQRKEEMDIREMSLLAGVCMALLVFIVFGIISQNGIYAFFVGLASFTPSVLTSDYLQTLKLHKQIDRLEKGE